MANNIGALPIVDMSSEQMQLAAQFLEFYLTRVPPRSAGYERATDTFNALVERLGIPKIELESPEVVYLSAVEARVAGQEVGLFDSAKSLSELLGEPKFESRPIAKYQDLAKLSWGETGDVLALVERGRIVRLSTKRVGDAILLRSAYEEVQGQFEVRVGMTEAQLLQVLDPKGDGGVHAQVTLLAGRAFFEAWTYYPALNFGVLFEDGVVAGVTVTPIKG